MATHASRPVALTIAGSDSSGGAGIQADLKTFSALGVYGASAITALTAQNTTGVQGVHPVPPAFVGQQIESVLTDLNVAAIKTGMLANAGIIHAVADALADAKDIPLIIDPVMVATSGDPLLEPEAVAAMRDHLFPIATLITPNLDEAAALLGLGRAQSRGDMEDQARDLASQGARAVLLKGGHLTNDIADGQANDLYYADNAATWFGAERIDTSNTHGTGCTLAAGIAACCALGYDLSNAIKHAKAFLTQALRSAARWQIGAGSGPVDHLFAVPPLEDFVE